MIRLVEVDAAITLPQPLARPVHEALRPEILQRPSRFVEVTMKRRGDRIELRFVAHSVAHMRAALNSYLRLIKAAASALEAANAQ